MQFDEALLLSPATKKDVADVATTLALTIAEMLRILEKLEKSGQQISSEIQGIRTQASILNVVFNQLTGFEP